MKQDKNDDFKCSIVEFDNMLEQKEYIKEAVKNKKLRIFTEIEPGDFFGNSTIEQSMDAMEYGLETQTRSFLDKLSDVSSDEGFNEGFYMDYTGFAYDMGSVVAGEPECCLNMSDLNVTKSINILVDIGFNGETTATQITNRSIAIVNLIETLMLKKYIVNLKFINYNIQKDMSTLVITNTDTKDVNIANIAMLSSPQFFRQITWTTRDVIRGKNSKFGRGYTESNRFFKEEIKKQDAFFIPGSFMDKRHYEDSTYCNVENANKYITQLFNNYCETKGE